MLISDYMFVQSLGCSEGLITVGAIILQEQERRSRNKLGKAAIDADALEVVGIRTKAGLQFSQEQGIYFSEETAIGKDALAIKK